MPLNTVQMKRTSPLAFPPMPAYRPAALVNPHHLTPFVTPSAGSVAQVVGEPVIATINHAVRRAAGCVNLCIAAVCH